VISSSESECQDTLKGKRVNKRKILTDYNEFRCYRIKAEDADKEVDITNGPKKPSFGSVHLGTDLQLKSKEDYARGKKNQPKKNAGPPGKKQPENNSSLQSPRPWETGKVIKGTNPICQTLPLRPTPK